MSNSLGLDSIYARVEEIIQGLRGDMIEIADRLDTAVMDVDTETIMDILLELHELVDDAHEEITQLNDTIN